MYNSILFLLVYILPVYYFSTIPKGRLNYNIRLLVVIKGKSPLHYFKKFVQLEYSCHWIDMYLSKDVTDIKCNWVKLKLNTVKIE